MLKIDQFIYTTASLERKKGYQIIASSNEITDELFSQIDPYLYPIGVNTSKFKESKSLLVFKKNKKIAFSKIKNIGIGYDGRSNTLYNHTLIMDLDDFAQIDYDTRILENFYFENYNIQGNLPQLKIEPNIPEVDFQVAKNSEIIVKETLIELIKKQKIAILDTKNIDLIQEMLSLVPPSMRLISFSTLVIQPERQPEYHLIQTKSQNKSILEKNYKIIDPENPSIEQKKNILNTVVTDLLSMINSRKKDELKELYESFEKIPGTDFKNKLIFLTRFSKYKTETDENLKERYAEEIVVVLKQLDKSVAPEYLAKIKPHLKQYAVLEDKLQSVISPTTSLIDAFFLLPLKAMNDLYNSYLEQHEKSENDEENE